jgi:hypothetical protein
MLSICVCLLRPCYGLAIIDAGMTEVARLRSVLLQGRDALVVAVESLDRAVQTIEASWPQLRPPGRIGQPVGDHHADLDDPEDEGPTVYDDLAAPLAKALAALRPGSQGGH